MSDLPKRLRIKASMIQLGEKIAWGSDTELMHEAADRIETLEAQLAAERADADRYRWLRDECDDWALFQGYVECEKEGLNAAIDAARKQATAPEQEGE